MIRLVCLSSSSSSERNNRGLCMRYDGRKDRGSCSDVEFGAWNGVTRLKMFWESTEYLSMVTCACTICTPSHSRYCSPSAAFTGEMHGLASHRSTSASSLNGVAIEVDRMAQDARLDSAIGRQHGRACQDRRRV